MKNICNECMNNYQQYVPGGLLRFLVTGGKSRKRARKFPIFSFPIKATGTKVEFSLYFFGGFQNSQYFLLKKSMNQVKQ